MCGIAGVVGASASDAVLEGILGQLAHRGPDDRGCHVQSGVALGHARLSIIDLARGHQPLFNERRNACIVFNGEIYNYRDLRGRLAGRHRFSTDSDTEVILHLYEELGAGCIGELDGMYSFALYDDDHGLLLARDPLGIKPLYVGWDWRGTLFFASEAKALTGVLPNVEEFPAGSVYSLPRGLVHGFRLEATEERAWTAEEALAQVRAVLRQAVEKRLVSDVPLGVFLSGGLDSSIIAALASQERPGVKTFSVGMENSHDRQCARRVADHLGTEHYEEVYTPEQMVEALPEVIYYLESFDAALVRSALPNYFLARLAARHVKVALSGEGADELFSGYDYLKKLHGAELRSELLSITQALHNTNLQRCDRMTMAHGLEARVPFLDVGMLRLAFSLPASLKLGPAGTEKWILREAFRQDLPADIVDRPKSKFSEGCGSMHVLERLAQSLIPDREFADECRLRDGRVLRSKEELLYYRIFHRFFPSEAAERLVGKSRSLEQLPLGPEGREAKDA